MKKIITVLTVMLLCLSNITCFAEGDISRLNDMADIFTASEEAKLLEKQDTLSDKYSVDIVVLTTNSLEGKKIADYAEGYFADLVFFDDDIKIQKVIIEGKELN